VDVVGVLDGDHLLALQPADAELGQAAVALSSSRALKSGSVQAFATTLAPSCGPTSFS